MIYLTGTTTLRENISRSLESNRASYDEGRAFLSGLLELQFLSPQAWGGHTHQCSWIVLQTELECIHWHLGPKHTDILKSNPFIIAVRGAYCVNTKRNMNYGILLSVSLLGWSKSNTLSMSDISSDRLMRRTRSCLLLPSAVVSPSCLLEQPKGRKTKTQKITAKITLQIKSLFIFLPLFETR